MTESARLAQPALPPDVVQPAADLLATQAVSPGCVGLAAHQVGAGPDR